MFKTRDLVRFSLIVGMQVILTQFIGITTPYLRITFTYLAMAFAGYFYGVWTGGFLAALADIVGMLVFPKAFYFAGFTVSAFVSGALFGLLKGKDENTSKWVLLIVVLDSIIVNLILNTLWLVLVYGQTFSVIIIPRVLKLGLSGPIMYFTTLVLMKYMKNFYKRFK